MFGRPTFSFMQNQLAKLVDAIDTTPIRSHPGDLQAELTDPNGCVNDPKKKEKLAKQQSAQEALEEAIFQEQKRLSNIKTEIEDLEIAIDKMAKEAKELADYHSIILNGMYQDEEENEEKKRLEKEIEEELKHIEDLVKQLNNLNVQLVQLKRQYDELQKRADNLRAELDKIKEEHNDKLSSLLSKQTDIILANYREAVDRETDPAKKQMHTEKLIQMRMRCDDAVKSKDVAKLKSEIDSSLKTTLDVVQPEKRELLLKSMEDCNRIHDALVAEFSDKERGKVKELGEVTQEMEGVKNKINKVEQQVKDINNDLGARMKKCEAIKEKIDNNSDGPSSEP